ncbi:unnamed protein product [Paramecium octaurelia]|uniref:Uncharacterized protein n=1 Tax=Paramecium octaurelia TaxID=43137 RepID=A0A8S1RYY0_PAROT|nr:unnamed protein product [Paramecium octaurelia]
MENVTESKTLYKQQNYNSVKLLKHQFLYPFQFNFNFKKLKFHNYQDFSLENKINFNQMFKSNATIMAQQKLKCMSVIPVKVNQFMLKHFNARNQFKIHQTFNSIIKTQYHK